MAHLIKRLAGRIFLSAPAQAANEAVDGLRQRMALRHWERTGRLLPPPHVVKQRTVQGYAREFDLHTLVETGTYLGAMVDATRSTFRRIHSVELDPAFYKRARKRFARYSHIALYRGDSGEVLPTILESIHEPCLFWLDAHHSGVLTARGALDSPVGQEITHILRHPVRDHVILIDDAHAFTGENGYPSLLALRQAIIARRPGWVFEVRYDIIRVHAPRPAAAGASRDTCLGAEYLPQPCGGAASRGGDG